MVRSRTMDSRKRPNDKSSVVFHSEMIQAFAKENHLHGQSELVISIIAQHWKMRLKPEHRVILQPCYTTSKIWDANETDTKECEID